MPHRTLTLIDAGRPLTVEAAVHGDAIRLSTGALEQGLGWELKPEGLCRAGTCVPIRGIDPMASEEFLALWQEGVPRYPAPPLPGAAGSPGRD